MRPYREVAMLIFTVYAPWFDLFINSYQGLDEILVKSLMSCTGLEHGLAADDDIRTVAEQAEALKKNTKHVWYIMNNIQEVAKLYGRSIPGNITLAVDQKVCDETPFLTQVDTIVELVSQKNSALCDKPFKALLYSQQRMYWELKRKCLDVAHNLLFFKEDSVRFFYEEAESLIHNIGQVNPDPFDETTGDLVRNMQENLGLAKYIEENAENASTYFSRLQHEEIIPQEFERLSRFIDKVAVLKVNKLDMIKQDFFQATDGINSLVEIFVANFTRLFLNATVKSEHRHNSSRKIPEYIAELSDQEAIWNHLDSATRLADVLEMMDVLVTSYSRKWQELILGGEIALELLESVSKKHFPEVDLDVNFAL